MTVNFNIKRLFMPIVCAGTGLLQFISLAFGYIGISFLGESDSASGFDIIGSASYYVGDLGGFYKFLAVMTLLGSLTLLFGGAFSIVREFLLEKIELLSDETVESINRKVIFGNMLQQCITYGLLLIMFVATDIDYGIGFHPSFGAFLILVFALSAFIVPRFIIRFLPDGAPALTCSQCGGSINKTDKFCHGCGAPVVIAEPEQAPAAPEQTPAAAPTTASTYTPPQPMNTPAPEAPVMVVVRACPQCGIVSPDGKKFCSDCGVAFVEKLVQK